MKQNDTAALTADLVSRFDAFEAELNGESSEALHEVRKEAMAAFKDMGLPDTKNEEYKYTPLGKVLGKQIDGYESTSGKSTAIPQKKALSAQLISGMEANVLLFYNGVFSEEHSRIVSPAEDMTIKPLSQAYRENPQSVLKYFARHADYRADAFTALNTAFAQEGSFIQVSKGHCAKIPTVMHFIQDAQGPAIGFPRNLILLEEGSQAQIIEKHDTLGEQAISCNTVTEIVLEERANGQFLKIQNDGSPSVHINRTQVYQAKNSTFAHHTFSFGKGTTRNNLHIVLDGERAEANMYGLYLLKGSSHVDNHTTVDHKKPHTHSNELYKGILDEQSKGVFNGKIYVRQDAQKTNAFQSNNNILLSDKATVNTKPQLEIWADDVKCSHGCTIGQLDKDALFYLRARGLSKESAKAILLRAFASDILDKVTSTHLSSYLEQIIAERLQ